jgi:hypothetical protein
VTFGGTLEYLVNESVLVSYACEYGLVPVTRFGPFAGLVSSPSNAFSIFHPFDPSPEKLGSEDLATASGLFAAFAFRKL